MTLIPGSLLGSYEIVAPLGAGGMGEVYRARDHHLEREVAVKVLPDDVSGHPERLARFEREAKLLASLNHPNIATVHGFEEFDGRRLLIMELLEGETLAARIGRRALTLRDALEIGRQICAGLEAAHNRAVIHRDLKPANVMIGTGGRVKILDFGLALALPDRSPAADASNAVTVTNDMTRPGVVMGTLGYLSPEQLRGAEADVRSDIWSLGCTLFETLSGRRAFEGSTVAELSDVVLSREPDWEALPRQTPPRVRRLLHRCLEKDPERRLRAAEHARIEMEESISGSTPTDAGRAHRLRLLPTLLPWGLALLLLAYVTWGLAFKRPGAVMMGHFILDVGRPLPSGLDRQERILAFSPDGSRLVHAGIEDGKQRLFLRNLGDFESKPIQGTELATDPAFSPNGQWVVFKSGHQLKKVSLAGGEPISLCDAGGTIAGITWAETDKIIFADFWKRCLMQVASSGGTPEALTTTTEEGVYHFWPDVLPGSKVLLFEEFPQRRIMARSLETGEQKVLVENGSGPRAAPGGYVLFGRGNRLFAARMDPSRLALAGPPVPAVEGVDAHPIWGPPQFAISVSGSLAYQPRWLPTQTLVRRGASGAEKPLAPPARGLYNPRLSADGQRLALTMEDEQGRDLWVLHLATGSLTRITFDAAVEDSPIWSPDGRHLAYSVASSGVPEIHWKKVDGSEGSERLVAGKSAVFPGTMTPDGRELIYLQDTRDTGADIAVVALTPEHETRLLLHETYHEYQPSLSPDGRWLAYTSNETGRSEIFVRTYPDLKRKWQVSRDGGSEPCWAHTGRELFFRRDDRYYSVPIGTLDGLTVGSPRLLFQGNYESGLPAFRSYDVSADDQSLILVRGTDQRPREIHVIPGWIDMFRSSAP